jgi:hypothetical protein
MSVNRSFLTTIEATLSGHRGFAIFGFPASAARLEGQQVLADPLPGNPAHAVVVGAKSDSMRKRLVRHTHWVVGPTSQTAMTARDGMID